MLSIPFESEGFPSSITKCWPAELSVTWDDILWAAVTVGRKNRYQVFRSGNLRVKMVGSEDRIYLTGNYEAVFRWSLARMALEQRSPDVGLLTRTEAASTLDRTEKGMVNYFLGMTFCKLFSDKLLNTPWLLHLDVFRSELNPRLKEGGANPDLVGQENKSSPWHVFECKGRANPPKLGLKYEAKSQAQNIECLQGKECSLHVAAITYFNRDDALQFYWLDPPPQDSERLSVNLPDSVWGYYYGPVAEIISPLGSQEVKNVRALTHTEGIERGRDSYGNLQVSIGQCDLEIGVHRTIENHLSNQDWEQARNAAIHAADEMEEGFQADGLRIRAGESWHERFQEPVRT